MVNKGVVYIGDVSGNLAEITASGQIKVDASVTATANISGQPVQISGQTVVASVVTNISGQTVVAEISGQTVVGSFTASVSGQPVKISGETVTAITSISGQTVSSTISGQPVRVSGETIAVSTLPVISVSGNTVVVSVSGQPVSVVSGAAVIISGQRVRVSGETIIARISGETIIGQISGQSVTVLSGSSISIVNVPNVIISGGALSGLPVTGSFTSNVSGNAVRISGETVITSILSGQTVLISGQPVVASVETNISGQTVYFASGNNAVQISGQTVVGSFSADISGDVVYLVSGNNAVQISGQTVVGSFTANVSGQPVRVSGETVISQISGQMVSISGQPVTTTVTTNISGQVVYTVSGQNTVQVSGQPIRLVSGFNYIVVTDTAGDSAIVINTASDSLSPAGLGMLTPSPAYAYNSADAEWTRLRSTPLADGYKLAVSISGQPVTTSVTTNISGQVVYLVSGQNPIQISGQLVAVSGTVASNISGNAVRISGESIKISGEAVRISGAAVIISGQPVQIASNQTIGTSISGNVVYSVSGNNTSQISGQLVVVSGSITVNNVPNVIISGGALSGITVSISGQPVTTTVVTNISGNVVYLVSGQNTSQISGQLVAVSGSIAVGNTPNVIVSGGALSGVTVSISGQPVAATMTFPENAVSGNTVYLISGQNSVQVSGQAIRITDNTGTEVADVIAAGGGQESYSTASEALMVINYNIGYDGLEDNWARLRVTASGDGHRLIVGVSGQPVYFVDDSINNKVKISGQLVAVSGSIAISNTPNVIISGGALSGITVLISGQPVVASVTTNISGQVVYLVSGNNSVQISGQLVSVSGTVAANISGNAVRLTDTAGDSIDAVSIGGEAYLRVLISGQPVTASVTTNVSGNVVYLTSGQNYVQFSGQYAVVSGVVSLTANAISGNAVRTSGDSAIISGQPVYTSGGAAIISGQIVKISGETISVSGIVALVANTISGSAVRTSGDSAIISGQPVYVSGGAVIVSGQPVSISGSVVYMVSGAANNVIQQMVPTKVRTRALIACTALSGGTQLLSGDVRKATVINAGVSGTVMYVGSTTDPPYSGFGAYLTWGNGITFEVTNFNILRVCAFNSGEKASYIGEQF